MKHLYISKYINLEINLLQFITIISLIFNYFLVNKNEVVKFLDF